VGRENILVTAGMPKYYSARIKKAMSPHSLPQAVWHFYKYFQAGKCTFPAITAIIFFGRQ
jgi:hypothetical protein